jgi:hypothetical protein
MECNKKGGRKNTFGWTSDPCKFGSVDLKGVASVWGTGGSPMVPNKYYREDGEESPSAKCSRGSLWWSVCVQALSCNSSTPNWRNTFEAYASRLVKASKRRSSMHHFTTKALTFWHAAVVSASTDMVTMLKNRLRMCLYLTHVLLTITCLYSK